MIKINLLPVRAEKKKETVRQHAVILGFSVAFVAIGFAAAYTMLLTKISGTKTKITQNEQDLQRLKTKIGEIDNIKKLQDEVKKKLDVLDKLRKEKTGPAQRLAALSDSIPEKLWLVKYTESGPGISINGISFSEEATKSFIDSLEGSRRFFNTELLVSEQVEIGGVKLKKFEISTRLELKKDEPKKDPAKKK